ncbi:MAG: prolipoprotein diacylglyceryl transferase, partial [Oscillospiraceae bacterium]
MTFDVHFPKLGLEFIVNRIAFSIGNMPIYWYGIFIAAGMMLALAFVFSNNKRFGINGDKMVDVIFLSTICAVLCGRAYYVAFAPFEYESFYDMINIRDGGMAIYGAIIGAFVFGALFCKLRKVKILPMFDLAAMGFLIGQGIGRWGNFVNQEAFGSNTTMPWGMISNETTNYLLQNQSVLAAQGVTVDPFMPVHPTFLYESIWCLVGFALLWAFSYRRKFDGEILLAYFTWYGTGRFIIEGFRTDSLMIGGIRVSQLVAVLMVGVSVILWVMMRRNANKKIKNGEKVLWIDIMKEKGYT